MRKLLFPIAIMILCISCNKIDETDNVNKTREKFLVDKIYDYNDYLVAEYYYDQENRLIKKLLTEHLGNDYKSEWVAYSDEFEYQNGYVSKIIRKDITLNIFNYETFLFYNSQKQLVRSELYMEHQLLYESDFNYKNGQVVSLSSNLNCSFFYSGTFTYDNLGNVKKFILKTPKVDHLGRPIAGTEKKITSNYIYDNHSKPNFGLDYLFVYDPLPFTEVAELQRCISNNNMTEFIGESRWILTFNENGLPATIQVKWKNLETEQPMVLKIKYKQID